MNDVVPAAHEFWPLSEYHPDVCWWCRLPRNNWQHAMAMAARPVQSVTRKPMTFMGHMGHMIMCVITFGLWIPVYIACAIRGRKEYTRWQ